MNYTDRWWTSQRSKKHADLGPHTRVFPQKCVTNLTWRANSVVCKGHIFIRQVKSQFGHEQNHETIYPYRSRSVPNGRVRMTNLEISFSMSWDGGGTSGWWYHQHRIGCDIIMSCVSEWRRMSKWTARTHFYLLFFFELHQFPFHSVNFVLQKKKKGTKWKMKNEKQVYEEMRREGSAPSPLLIPSAFRRLSPKPGAVFCLLRVHFPIQPFSKWERWVV